MIPNAPPTDFAALPVAVMFVAPIVDGCVGTSSQYSAIATFAALPALVPRVYVPPVAGQVALLFTAPMQTRNSLATFVTICGHVTTFELFDTPAGVCRIGFAWLVSAPLITSM